jgi:hypothetical protein
MSYFDIVWSPSHVGRPGYHYRCPNHHQHSRPTCSSTTNPTTTPPHTHVRSQMPDKYTGQNACLRKRAADGKQLGPGVNDALQSRSFFPSHGAHVWATSVGKEVVQVSHCWCPSYLDLCPHRPYISTVLFLELHETLTVTTLLDLPLKSGVCLFEPRLYLLYFHRISWSCCYLRDLSRGLLLEGPVLSFRLLGILYEVADERLYVTPLPSCRPSICDPLLRPKPFV